MKTMADFDLEALQADHNNAEDTDAAKLVKQIHNLIHINREVTFDEVLIALQCQAAQLRLALHTMISYNLIGGTSPYQKDPAFDKSLKFYRTSN